MKTRDLLSADLEQLLAGVSGAFPWWQPVRPQPVSSVDGVQVQVVRRSGQAALLVVEIPPGAPFPSVSARYHLRELVGAEADVLLFTDASHSRMVFCGVVPTGSGVPVFEEYSFGGSTFPLAVLFRRRSRPPVLPAARVEGREAVIAVVANSLRAGGGWSPVHPDPGHWMQEVGDADTLRRFISLIRRVVVLGRGGSGNWLLGAGDALEWLHRLVLARARSFLIDVYPPGRTRPEYLRDFRQAVEIADGSTDRSAVGVAVEISFGRAIGVPDGSSGSSRVAMVAGPSGGFTPDVVRRSVAQRQLFGLMCDAREAAHLRRQLESWVGFRHRESLEIDINVAVDYVQSASWLPREEAGLVAYEPLFAAWKLIAGDRLVRHDVEPDAWKVAAEALVRRRRKLFPPLKSAPSGGSTGMWIETAFPLLAGQRQNAIPVEQGSGRGRHD